MRRGIAGEGAPAGGLGQFVEQVGGVGEAARAERRDPLLERAPDQR